MSFDAVMMARPRRIAIVGGGISGLAAAYLLAPNNKVTLFEAEPQLGGHARTVMAGRYHDQPVDTGFIVFNYSTYPHLTRLFAELDVPVIKSEMSFGVSIDHGRFEYGLKDIQAILGQRRNALRPAYLRMLYDIVRFHGRAEGAASTDEMTIDQLIDDLRLGDWFRDYYLLPVCGAIWSTPATRIGAFPARTMVQFFRNHGLLSATKQHQWWTVKGGSVEYVGRLERRLRRMGCDLRPATPVTAIERGAGSVGLRFRGGEAECFDEVVLACHSDQALRLLRNPTAEEDRLLSAIRYQDNRAVLHCDEGQMPRRRACWSSWVYKADTREASPRLGVTYWMNRLQNIADSDPLFVTLNPTTEIAHDMIYDDKLFRHPVFDTAAVAAQAGLGAIQGRNRTWFAGAYTRHGFHEDGFASAVAIAERMEMQNA